MTASRRYLITGGTGGIGEMCADHLTREGHRVWITGTWPESVTSALHHGRADGATVCDVSDAPAVEGAFEQALGALGGLGEAFLNAGIDGECRPAEQLDPQHYRLVLDVNVVGALQCAQVAHRTLERPGSIVISAAVNAIRPEAHFADYNSSKAARAAVRASFGYRCNGVVSAGQRGAASQRRGHPRCRRRQRIALDTPRRPADHGLRPHPGCLDVPEQ